MPKRFRWLWVKDLPKVPTWQLKWDSNLRPSGLKSPNLPLSSPHYNQACSNESSVPACLLGLFNTWKGGRWTSAFVPLGDDAGLMLSNESTVKDEHCTVSAASPKRARLKRDPSKTQSQISFPNEHNVKIPGFSTIIHEWISQSPS